MRANLHSQLPEAELQFEPAEGGEQSVRCGAHCRRDNSAILEVLS